MCVSRRARVTSYDDLRLVCRLGASARGVAAAKQTSSSSHPERDVQCEHQSYNFVANEPVHAYGEVYSRLYVVVELLWSKVDLISSLCATSVFSVTLWWILSDHFSPPRHKEHGGCTEKSRLGHFPERSQRFTWLRYKLLEPDPIC